MGSLAPLPIQIFESAEKGELQKVVKWLRKGGLVDALCSTTAANGRPTTATLLHAAAAHGHPEIAEHGCQAGEQGTLPKPQPSKYHPQLHRGAWGGG